MSNLTKEICKCRIVQLEMELDYAFLRNDFQKCDNAVDEMKSLINVLKQEPKS